MQVLRVTFLEWNRAPWRAQLDAAVADYLRRSREEITEEEEWQLLNLAMLGRQDLLFLVVTDGNNLLGFGVFRLLAGTAVTGPVVQVWQTYVVPGRARLRELFALAWPEITAWGEQFGARRATLNTRRGSPAYVKLLRSLGFREYGVMLERDL